MEGKDKETVSKSEEEEKTGKEEGDRQEALCLFTKGKRHRPAGLRRREAPPDVTQSVEYPSSAPTSSVSKVEETTEEEDVSFVLPTKRRAGTSLQTAKAIESLVHQRKQRESGGADTSGTALESLQYAPGGSTVPTGAPDPRATAPDLLHAEDTALAARKVSRLPGTGPARPPE